MRIAVFTKNRSNPAYESARAGADRAAKQLGVETVHYVPAKDDDPEEQSALIGIALRERPDAVVLAPVHASRVNAAIERIHAAGVPLFGFVNPIPVGPCVTYVGADDYALGRAVARRLFGHLERGRVLLVSGPAASVTSLARMRAFRDAAAERAEIAIAGTCDGNYSRDAARAAVAGWLAANEAPDGCLAANDVMALGALDALRAARRRSAVAGVNAIPEAIEAIKRGDMLATADFSAMHMAYLATECAVRHLRGETVPEKIELPAEIVDKSNCRRWDLPFAQRPLPTLRETLEITARAATRRGSGDSAGSRE